MPTLYKYYGLVFLMLFNDHEPVHVHVRYGNLESVIEILRDPHGNVIEVRERRSSKSAADKNKLPQSKLKIAKTFVNIKAEEFVKIWMIMKSGNYNEKPININRKLF